MTHFQTFKSEVPRLTLATGAVVLLVAASAAQAQDFATLKTAADRRDGKAAYQVARMYETGQDRVCKNLAKAQYYYSLARGAGNQSASADVTRVAQLKASPTGGIEPQAYAVSYVFQSASARQAVSLMDQCGKGALEPHVFDLTANASPNSVSTSFVDLPVALQAVRKNGMREPVSSAMLYTHYRRGGAPVSAWQIGPYVVDASNGEVLPKSALDDSYERQLNEQFQGAAAAIRAAGNMDGFPESSQRTACQTVNRIIMPLGSKGQMYTVKQNICP
jgi:TPR repeat protein